MVIQNLQCSTSVLLGLPSIESGSSLVQLSPKINLMASFNVEAQVCAVHYF